MTHANIIDLIESKREEIEAEMERIYRHVLWRDGQVQVTLYMWDDGEFARLEAVQGDNSWLQTESDSRELFHIAIIDAPFFDWRDYIEWNAETMGEYGEEPETPEQEAARDVAKKAVIDCEIDDTDFDERVDQAILGYEQEFNHPAEMRRAVARALRDDYIMDAE